MTLADEVAAWVGRKLSTHRASKPRDLKVIRDPVAGLVRLSEIESYVIDSPFMQRLRSIRQTACSYFLYPGATHTRFEHCLGVMNAVDQYCSALNATKTNVDGATRHELKLAGLLHDVGHCLFSHLGETIYEELPSIKQGMEDPRFQTGSELLAYRIVTSKPFTEFVGEAFTRLRFDLPAPNLDHIGDYIVGSVGRPQLDQFKVDIVNGPVDADKLDYLLRDAHYTGLVAPVDVEMITREAKIAPFDGKMRLCFDSRGLHILEQLVFSKLQMYSTLYHHHKVRATECMVAAIFELIHDHPEDSGGIQFLTVEAFLDADDSTILNHDTRSKGETQKMVLRLKNRVLFKRALVLSYSTVSEDSREKLLELANEERGDLVKLRNEIAAAAKIDDWGGSSSVWIDIPDPPSFPELGDLYLEPAVGGKNRLGQLVGEDWIKSYREFKWKGFVFGPGDSDARKRVGTEARRILESEYGIKFESSATEQAKLAS
jgi:uncharacterized protein